MKSISKMQKSRCNSGSSVLSQSDFGAGPECDLEQIGHGVGVELFHDVGAVRLHRLDADAQVISDLLVQSTGDDALKHLGFARRQP